MRKTRSFLLPLLLSLVLGVIVSAGFYQLSVAETLRSGDLDPTFGGQGTGFVVGDFEIQDNLTSMVVQPAGQIYIAGSLAFSDVITSELTSDFFLARYSSDGVLDGDFGSSGMVETDFYGFEDTANALALQEDGKILLAGLAANAESGPKVLALARYHADGSPDLTFGDQGKATNGDQNYIEVSSLALQNDGKILAAGTITATTTTTATLQTAFLARFNPDGDLDQSFGGTNGGLILDELRGARAREILLQTDGKIIVGMYKEGFARRGLLKRYTPDGLLDETFGVGGSVDIAASTEADPPVSLITNLYALALQPDGKIIAAGSADDTVEENFLLARFHPDGRLDTSYGLNGITLMNAASSLDDWAVDIQLQRDGKLAVLGTYSLGTANATAMVLARFTPSGLPDMTFGAGGIQLIDQALGNRSAALGIQDSGHIVIAGTDPFFLNLVPFSNFVLARYQNDVVPTLWLPLITRQ